MKTYFLRLLILIFLFGIAKLNASETSPQYINGNDTLVVYKSIPNLPEFMPRVEASEKQDIRTVSDKYTIRVRSAATNNEWVDVLALYTYNRAVEIPDMNPITGSNSTTSVQNYPNATAGWSQTYGNIEMSYNQLVEVEIAPKNGFKIKNQDFFKATVHPSQKASAATVVNGKVYFTIRNPAQVAIDINGLMDDHNAFINPIGTPTDGVSSKSIPLHTITFFANPVIKKPTLNASRTFYVVDGKMPTVSPSTYDVLYFMPGVHDIGLNNKIYPGKSVYIPGDAIIFGSINNDGVPFTGFSKAGERIKIFGYGTISGARIKHPNYVTNPGIREPININGALNYEVKGITIADGAHFSLWTPSGSGGFVSYVKVIGWRANGDGLGNGDNVNDCFVRTNDDCSYVRGNRKRVTYWKDNISAIFYMSAVWTSPILIEDCDVLYCRSRGGGGAAWDMRGDNAPGVNQTQTTFRNIRFHDKLSNMEIFNLVSFDGDNAYSPTRVAGSYNWMKFENISIASSSVKSNLLGCAASQWDGGLTFDNVTFGGTLLTQQNFKTYFNTNEFVKNTIFKGLVNNTISLNVNGGVGGSVAGGGTFKQGQSISVTATPSIGYQFVNWTENGIQQSNNNTFTFVVDKNRILTANFTNTPQTPVVDFKSNTNNITAGDTVKYTDITTYNPISWLWTFAGGTPATSTAQNPTVIYPAPGAYSVTLTATNSVGPGTLTKTSFVNVAPAPVSETLPWNESFTLPNGTNSDVAPTSWTATNMSVQNNEMSFNYVGEGVFKTGVIDISSGLVTVSVKIRGGSGLDVGQDYLKLFKKVDGGAEEEIGFANGPVTVSSFTANISNGTKLELILRARVSSASEYYYFDDINVNSVSPVYQLSISANPTIGGTASGSGTYNSGQTTTITASPSIGYKFDNWKENGVIVSTNSTFTLTVSATRIFVANFSAIVIPTYQVTVSANPAVGGTVSGGGTFNSGQTTTITASPSTTGYKFDNWKENGVIVSTISTFTMTVSAARTLVANFSVNTNVSQELDNLTFNVYPNPATDIIHIDFNDIERNKEIKLINNLGQVVYCNITKETTVLVNLKTLNIRGLILVQVMIGKNKYYKKLLVS